MKNEATLLLSLIQERFPKVEIAVDSPTNSQGSWWLDIVNSGHTVTVEWTEKAGFGVSSREDALYGELADETYLSVDDAYQRVVRLLLSGSETVEPQLLDLKHLRKYLAVSQVDLAKRLNITQASVSKFENRDDCMIGTLRSLINALGGDLEIRALFNNTIIRLDIDESRSSNHA